jgi:stage V sporulation protein B
MTPTASSEIVETVFKLVCGLALPQYVLKYAERSFAETHGCFGIYFADKNELLSACKPFMAAAAILGVSAASFAACVFIFVRTGLLSRTRRHETANRFNSPPPDISRKSAVAKLMKFALPSSLIAVISTLSGMADLVTITPQLKKAMAVSPQLFEYLGAYGISESERAAFVYGSYTGLALTVYGLLPTFTAMLGKSALPSLTTAYACKNWEESGRCVSSMLLISAIISMSGGLGICVLAKPLLVLFFGSSAAEISVADTPLSILAIAVIFTGIALPCLSVLQACSRQFLAAAITLVGAAIKLFLNFTLIKLPLFGINGAAVSTAVSQAVMCVWAVAALIRCSGSGKTAVRSVFIPLIPAILCAAAAYLAQKCVVMRFDGVIGRVGVLFSIAFGSIICLISLALLCISPKNRIKNLFFKKNTKTS